MACIDQTANSAEMAAEIGRQAKIFRGATQAFVWFTKHTVATINSVLETMTTFHTRAAADPSAVDGKMNGAWRDLGIIDSVIDDPWFTSLWTLQEAFLRQDALLLTQEGKPWPNGELSYLVSLKDLMGLLEPLANDARYNEHQNAMEPDACREMAESLDRSGLISLTVNNPIALLSVAQNRKTGPDNTADRVYGIMQVFDLRLGKSRPGVDSARQFRLEELEDELGIALMTSYPVVSQLFVYNEAPAPGKGWRMGPTARIAYYLKEGVYEDTKDPVNSCVNLTQLSTELVGSTLWGRFEGPTCSVTSLYSVWEMLESARITPVSIALDYTTERRDRVLTRNILPVMKHVADTYNDARILYLGYTLQGAGDDRRPGHAVGLIILPYQAPTGRGGVEKWKRIGICSWSLEWKTCLYNVTEETTAFMMGQGDRWTTERGLFG